jgi:hypothetical protein
MAQYMQFITSDDGVRSEDGTILIEVTEEDVSSPEGTVKAGVAERVQNTVVQAQATFEGALDRVIQQNAQTLIRAARNLAQPPDELEVTFGLKATGEVGNFAIAKGGGEANFAVRILWKHEAGNQ